VYGHAPFRFVGDVGALPLASWGYPTRLRGRIAAWEPHSHMAFRFNQGSDRTVVDLFLDYRFGGTF